MRVMRRLIGSGLLAATVAWMLAPQAQAISRGTPDGNNHPMVAALGMTTPEGVFQTCGATLVSETVMVTAAHCLVPGPFPPGSELRVDFGSNAVSDDPGWFAPVGAVADPEFVENAGVGSTSDIGVVLLAPGQSGGRPLAQLPARDELGAMAREKTLASAVFDLVGYGCQANGSSGGPHRLDCTSFERMAATAPFKALTSSWLVLSMNVDATGEGGQCYGDSGGPQFLRGTTRVVSVTHTGDHWCRATNTNARLDTDTARAFLSQFVAVP
jgi:trypsin